MTVVPLYALPPVPPIEGRLAEPLSDPLDFRWYLIELGLAPRTVEGYTNAMLKADAWCEERGYPLPTVPGPVIAEYADTLPKSWSSRRRLRSTMKHYWAMHDRKRPPLWAIKVPRKPRMVCRALSVEEAARLAAVARARADRAGLATLVGLYQAFRRQEIATMAWSDLTEPGWIQVMGKGDLPAKLPLNPIVEAALDAHRPSTADRRSARPAGCTCAASEPSRWVFPARIGDGHVNPAVIWGWVQRVAEQAGIKNMTTHRLRHTALATALDACHDLRAVADFARHASVETTQGYTRTTEERLMAAMAAVVYEEDVTPPAPPA